MEKVHRVLTIVVGEIEVPICSTILIEGWIVASPFDSKDAIVDDFVLQAESKGKKFSTMFQQRMSPIIEG